MFVGWMIDIAREQSPREPWLREVLERSLAAGYGAVGFYLEHRYAYPSAPWAAGPGALTPEVVLRLREEFEPRGLRLIPLLNTLGHMEGFVRVRGGEHLAENGERYANQTCPSDPAAAALARMLVADAMDAFADEWVHLGGDEVWQLGQCPRCAARVREAGKAGLYADFYGPLCRWVLERGRRPCLWGDMLLQHPEALDALPRETIVFDWQYERGPAGTSRVFRERGFDVVCCPSVQTYHAPFCALDATRDVIDAHAAQAPQVGALGVMVTTWELMRLSAYDAVMPLIYAAGKRLAHGTDWSEAIAAEGGAVYAEVAELLGVAAPRASAYLRGGGKHHFRKALVDYQDPFELWRQWRQEATGPAGERVAALCAEAASRLPEPHPLWLPLLVLQTGLLWVRIVERAAQAYTQHGAAAAREQLARARGLLAGLAAPVQQAAQRGGSQIDLARLERAEQKLEIVLSRLEALQAAGGALPSFAVLVHDRYLAGDQDAWFTRETGSTT